jgi:hypothetical protein
VAKSSRKIAARTWGNKTSKIDLSDFKQGDLNLTALSSQVPIAAVTTKCVFYFVKHLDHLAREQTTQIDNTKIDTVAITRLAYTMRSCRRPRRAASA